MAARPKRKCRDDVATDVNHICFSIRDQEGRQLFFKVVQDLELVKVFKDFCDRRNMEYETVRFLYDGAHINGRQTPKMLNMENGAEIFAARQQLGGGVATLLYSHVFNRSF